MASNNRLRKTPIVRGRTARSIAQDYVAALLLDSSKHADAFDNEALTEAEREIARDEVKRLGIELLERYKCEL
ncbi:hypothetical protein ACFSB1_10665 [Halopseudomonas phragmitis]|uniref:Uncharacterized protein n=1 Tax=Halopseudomonas phragmitis TaxID=1931241 RepID=A0A1V0B9C6_9GAMM|nr:hypothetical protein [Halopseudomonas phragmitis]AQZ96546.1 hypothetical protein BVH74_18110 [Halopseudomonas phragmitis]